MADFFIKILKSIRIYFVLNLYHNTINILVQYLNKNKVKSIHENINKGRKLNQLHPPISAVERNPTVWL